MPSRPLPRLRASPRLLGTLVFAALPAVSWADPMRPLILPTSATTTVASAAPSVAPGDYSPLRSRSPETATEPDRLVAIRQDGASRWLALFGERWVAVGDKVDPNYTVAEIDANRVQLNEKGRPRRTLHLLPPLVQPDLPTASANAAGPPGGARSVTPRRPVAALAHAAAPPVNRSDPSAP